MENRVLVDEKGEIRAKNYQVVCSPCKHPSGNNYESNDAPIRKVTEKFILGLLKPYLRKEEIDTTPKKQQGKDTSRSGEEYRQVIKKIGEGKTKEQVYKDMDVFKKWSESPEQYKKLTYEKAKKYIETQNKNKTKEPKRKEEWKYLNYLPTDFMTIEYKKDGSVKKSKVSIPKVTECILEMYDFKTIFGSKSEEVFIFEEGVWVEGGKKIIKETVEHLLSVVCSNHLVNEIFEKIKRLTAISKEEFDKIPEELICLEKEVLNLKTRKLEEHNPKYYFKTKIPIKYEKEASCPKIKKFLKDTFYPEDIKTIQEWFGFSLYRRYFIKKAMIIFGAKDTSKTVFLNLLTKFIGEKNRAGLSLQRISGEDKFALANLKGKYVNIFDDLSSKDLSAGGFKMATGDGFITAEKKFGDSFSFLNYAKHTFATNKIPQIKDIDAGDDAYYDRWMALRCDNQISKKQQDRFLINKLTTPEELSGLLNWALEGLKRLLKKGMFSYEKSSKEIKMIMERQGNPLSAFIQDVLVRDDGHKISVKALFEIYSLYCRDENCPRLSKTQLGNKLGKKAGYILAKHSSKTRFWENVNIRQNNDSHIKHDTYDTFTKTIRDDLKEVKRDSKNKGINSYNISKKKLSYASQQKNPVTKKSNTKPNTPTFEDSSIKEELENE